MSAGAKAAGFAALLRILMRALPTLQHDWQPLLAVVAMLTMTVGNVTALLQNNVKRMLAYSSIAHAGYILVALAAGGRDGSAAAVFYLAVYSFMNLGAFALLTMMGRGSDEPVLVSDLAGLGFRQPLAGLALTLFMVSLGGIPPTAGFMGKVLVFGAAVKAGLVWPLVVVGVLNSVVSVFYYLRITVALYMREPEGEPVGLSLNAPAVAALLLTAAATLWWGLQAGGLWQAAQRSVLGIL
jgi:NADH-quinone oxidoreductase subunit N